LSRSVVVSTLRSIRSSCGRNVGATQTTFQSSRLQRTLSYFSSACRLPILDYDLRYCTFGFIASLLSAIRVLFDRLTGLFLILHLSSSLIFFVNTLFVS
jgi:hypothetical protein